MPEQTLSDGASRSVLNSSPAILGASAVLALIGLSRTSLWRRVRDGDFPAPVRLVGHASRAVGWRRVDVERWLEALAEGVGRRLERSGIGGDPIRRGVKRQRVGTTAIDSSLTERPRVLEPSSRRYPASAAEADAKRCLYSPGAAAVGAYRTRRRSRIRPGPVRAPLSGRQPATAGPAGAPPKARMAVGRPLAVPAVKENSPRRLRRGAERRL